MLTPRLVLNNNLDFTKDHYLGLSSLLVESGYQYAEMFIKALRQLVIDKSVTSLLKTYISFATPSIAICSLSLLVSINKEEKNEWVNNLIMRSDTRLKSLYGDTVKAASANINSYKEIFDWYGYNFYSIDNLISDPYSFILWAGQANPDMSPSSSALYNDELSDFIAEAVLLNTNLDLRLNRARWSEVRRWINLTFTKYAFGSSIDQARWF